MADGGVEVDGLLREPQGVGAGEGGDGGARGRRGRRILLVACLRVLARSGLRSRGGCGGAWGLRRFGELVDDLAQRQRVKRVFQGGADLIETVQNILQHARPVGPAIDG